MKVFIETLILVATIYSANSCIPCDPPAPPTIPPPAIPPSSPPASPPPSPPVTPPAIPPSIPPTGPPISPATPPTSPAIPPSIPPNGPPISPATPPASPPSSTPGTPPSTPVTPPATPPPGVASDCGLTFATQETRIVNGNDSNVMKRPWIVRLSTMGTDAFCGGSVIDEHWVLTAAHCFDEMETVDDFLMIFGDTDRSQADEGEYARRASAMYIHPAYNRTLFDFDYALLKLQDPLDLSTWYVQKVCLPPGNCPAESCAGGADAFIAGWGLLESNGAQPHILREAKITIFSEADCLDRWIYSSPMTERMICAMSAVDDGNLLGICQGDSGGPMVEFSNGVYTLCGVASFGKKDGCGDTYAPAGFAKVCDAMDWIEGIMNCEVDPVDGYCPSMCSGGCPAYSTCVAVDTCICIKEGNLPNCNPVVEPTTAVPFPETLPPVIGDCGIPSGVIQPRLAGGNDADMNEYPWVVRVSSQETSSSVLCGGAVIHENWVLTSGECLSNGLAVNEMVLFFGDRDRTIVEDGETSQVPTAAYIHPSYMDGPIQDYNYGLLKLPTALNLSGDSIKKICLPPSNCHPESCYPGVDAFIAGWGKNDAFTTEYENVLQMGEVDIRTDFGCYWTWGIQYTANSICTEGNNFDKIGLCVGDQGGPLMQLVDGRYTVCGVSSKWFGWNCGELFGGSLYAKVCQAVDWIEEIINCPVEPTDGSCPS